MRALLSILLGSLLLAPTSIPAIAADTDDNWLVAEGQRNGFPIIVRAKAELPEHRIRKQYGWLTVITWTYSVESGGLPGADENQKMNNLEDTIESRLEATGLCMAVASRTGNGKKEWSYYVRDRDEFISAFNKVMHGKPRLPLTMHFYHDPAWQELNRLLDSVKR
ncbi:MAG TPA: DUF695 domain-containing protein [Noviherbaspirillum sp.]